MRKNYTTKGIKIIFRYLAEYKKDIIVLSVLGVISAIANGIVPYLAGRLFDAILDPSKIFIGTKIEMPLFLFFIILWGIAQLSANIVDWRSGVKNSHLMEKIHAFYIVKAFGHLLELPISFHKEKKMGQVMNRINRAVGALVRISGEVVISLAPQFLSIVIALVITFYINYMLASLLLIGIITYLAILVKAASPFGYIVKKNA